MNKKRKLGVMLVACGISLSMNAGIAVADSGSSETGRREIAETTRQPGLPAPVTAALDRLKETGQLTSEDRNTLLQYPEVAAQVVDPDPAATELEIVDSGESAPDTDPGIEARRGCWRANVAVMKRTLLGYVAYKFHQYVDWCNSPNRIYKIRERYHYLSRVDPNQYFRNLTGNSYSGVGERTVTSFMQAHMENCVVRYGCIGSSYPWIRLVLKLEGRFDAYKGV